MKASKARIGDIISRIHKDGYLLLIISDTHCFVLHNPNTTDQRAYGAGTLQAIKEMRDDYKTICNVIENPELWEKYK